MKKADFELLGKVFASEFCNFPLFQTNAKKRVEDLESRGLVERIEVSMGGRPPMICRGWKLTQIGHIEYCYACPVVDEKVTA